MNTPNQPKENRPLYYLNKYFYWFIIIIISVVSLSFYSFLFKPQLQRENLKNFSEQTAIIKLNGLKKQAFEIEEIIAKYNEFSAGDLSKINEILPTEADIPNLIVQLDTLTKQAGLTLASFSVSQPTNVVSGTALMTNPTENNPSQTSNKPVTKTVKEKEIKKLTIALNLEDGDYEALKQVVALIESNLRLMDIASINFGGEAQSYLITLNAYYYGN
ncbi:MAG: hypothetical protein WC480_03590 [Patescibacteria group bacterium]